MPKIKPTQKDRKVRQEKIEQAIVMVNDVCKIRIAQSEVHGVGVFAIRDIKKGERVYADAMPVMLDIPYKKFNKINPEIKQLILERFPRVVDGSQFMAPDTLMQIYMNHQDNPNYDNKTDKATRKIKAGEEIFEDYKAIEGWEVIHKWLVD
jgi:SET domain-containing protein